MKVKTSELTGGALDWAVAIHEGYTRYDPSTDQIIPPNRAYEPVYLWDLTYSTDWGLAGPIIERENIEFKNKRPYYDQYRAFIPEFEEFGGMYERDSMSGPTILIAAMRCVVASKFGVEIEIPDELLN